MVDWEDGIYIPLPPSPLQDPDQLIAMMSWQLSGIDFNHPGLTISDFLKCYICGS